MAATEISDRLLSSCNSRIARLIGVSYSGDRLGELSGKIPAIAKEFGFDGAREFLEWLLANDLTPEHLGVLAQHLTVGETYFFRDPELFDHLRKELLPQLLRSRTQSRILRIWSAGCCSGEEIYSLAMLLDDLLPGKGKWQIQLTGTDINPVFLDKARSGLFREFSLRSTPDPWKERYFEPRAERGYELSEEIKSMVSFRWLNLVSRESALTAPRQQDIIICRNVLMYFAVPEARHAMELLESCLADDGFLLVSPFDVSLTGSSHMTLISRPGLVYLQKNKAKQAGEDGGASSLDPGNTAAPAPFALTTFTQAKSLYVQARYQEAIALLAGEAQPDVDSMLLLCRCLSNHDELDQALETCDRAIDADNLNPVAYYLRASIMQMLGRVAEAVRDLKKVIFLQPNFVMAEFTLGSVLVRCGKEAQGRKHFANALDLVEAVPPSAMIQESEGINAETLRSLLAAILSENKNV